MVARLAVRGARDNIECKLSNAMPAEQLLCFPCGARSDASRSAAYRAEGDMRSAMLVSELAICGGAVNEFLRPERDA
jgi:hypothetical protein